MNETKIETGHFVTEDEIQSKRVAWLPVAIIAAIVVAGALVAFILLRPEPLPAPAKPVQKLLELRQERSKDTSAYAELVKSPSVAEALVSDVTTKNAGTSPIPPWEPLYLSAQSTSTADVVVIWKKDPKFKKWAKATVFTVERLKGKWLVGDAEEVTGTVPPALNAKTSQ